MSPFENHPQWVAISEIHRRLKKKGFQSVIAGGAVRDLLLGRTPNDIDIATDAKPEQVEALFEKTVMVGKIYGVARVILSGQDVEVATFRKDGLYLDGRKPESVEFCKMEEDAKRRDFTINAMFYDLDTKEVIDLVGGQKHIMQKLICTVGEPEKRFDEDKLRILRALRFHSQLGFSIEKKTSDAIRKFGNKIHQVSMERVRDEWQKLMQGKHAVSGFSRVHDLGLWTPLFDTWKYQPEEYKRHYTGLVHDPDKMWILWFLIHNGESVVKLGEAGLRWKLPKKLIQKMIFCLQSLSQLRNIQNIEPVDLAIFMGKADGRVAVEIYQLIDKGRIKEIFYDKVKKAESFLEGGRLPDLLITGDDLIQYGIAPGPKIAQTLKYLYRIQLLESVTNKEDLMQKLT